jgi:transposase
MAWTDLSRREYDRRTPRYASDVSDREWSLIAPFMPPFRLLGRPRRTLLREVVNAPLYIAATGCQWHMLPKNVPPYSTIQDYFYAWRVSGLWGKSTMILCWGA